MVVGVRNLRTEVVNVTLCAGSVNLVQQFSQFQQNLTVHPYSYPVEPGQEVSLPYMFQLAPQLGAVKYQGGAAAPLLNARRSHASAVALTLLYTSGSESYGDTFFNRTLELAEAESSWTPTSLSIAAVMLGGAAYVLYGKMAPAPKPAAKVVLSSEAAPKTADKSEWLVGTPAAAKAAKAKKAA